MDNEKLKESRSDGGAIKKTFSYDGTRSVGMRPSPSGLRRYTVQPKPEEKKYDFRDYIIKEVPKVQVHTIVPYQQENNTGDSETRAKILANEIHGLDKNGETIKAEPGPDQGELRSDKTPNPELMDQNTVICKQETRHGRMRALASVDGKIIASSKQTTPSYEKTSHPGVLDISDDTADKETQEKIEPSSREEMEKDTDEIELDDVVRFSQACASELQEEIIEKDIEEYLVALKAVEDVEQTIKLDLELRPTQFLDLDVTSSKEENIQILTQKKKVPLWTKLFTQITKTHVRHDKVNKICNEDLEDEPENKDKHKKFERLQRVVQRLRQFRTTVRRRFKLLKNRILGRY